MTLTHKPISGIVSNLCKEFSVRKKAIDLGAVPALVALLSAPQPQLLKNALTALLLLCGDYKGRDQVMAADPSQALLHILDSEYRELQELTLNLVATAARTEGSPAGFKTRGAPTTAAPKRGCPRQWGRAASPPTIPFPASSMERAEAT